MTCYSLVLSNNRINDLEYKSEKLREENLGIIELMKSNILEELNYMLKNTSTEDEFYKLLKKNNYKDFIDKIKNIYNVDSKSIELAYEDDFSNKQFIHYRIQIKSQIKNYKKYSYINLKIENPWFGRRKNSKKENNEVEVKDATKNKENLEEKIDGLITFYNYEEG